MTQFKTFDDLVFEDWGARRNQLPCLAVVGIIALLAAALLLVGTEYVGG